MTKSKRGRYTLEFKQEAARLVESGQSQAAAARSLGVVEQTLGNWVREHRAGTLKGASSKPLVSAEQMENSRLRAELARASAECVDLVPGSHHIHTVMASRFRVQAHSNARHAGSGKIQPRGVKPQHHVASTRSEEHTS